MNEFVGQRAVSQTMITITTERRQEMRDLYNILYNSVRDRR
jgi:hypothetical protein